MKIVQHKYLKVTAITWFKDMIVCSRLARVDASETLGEGGSQLGGVGGGAPVVEELAPAGKVKSTCLFCLPCLSLNSTSAWVLRCSAPYFIALHSAGLTWVRCYSGCYSGTILVLPLCYLPERALPSSDSWLRHSIDSRFNHSLWWWWWWPWTWYWWWWRWRRWWWSWWWSWKLWWWQWFIIEMMLLDLGLVFDTEKGSCWKVCKDYCFNLVLFHFCVCSFKWCSVMPTASSMFKVWHSVAAIRSVTVLQSWEETKTFSTLLFVSS